VLVFSCVRSFSRNRAMASMFQTPMFSQQPAQQAQAQQGAASHIHLLTNDKMPVSYQTKWADISPESQQLLLTIE
jgi:hypothetical protein